MTAPAAVRDTVSVRELEQHCELFGRGCVQQGASAEEVAKLTPAADADVHAWLNCYKDLGVLHARLTKPMPAADASDTLRAAEALQSMLSATPIRVALALDRGTKDAEHPDGMTVHVHPKSPGALRWLESLDGQMRRYASAYTIALALEVPSDDQVLALVPLCEDLAVRLWAWILTHDGPKLPFNPYDAASALPPTWTEHLTHEDLTALWLAHYEIHYKRHEVAGAAFAGGDRRAGALRLPLDGFLAAFADAQAARMPDVLMNWSLGEQVGRALAKAAVERDAMKRADDDARTRRN